MFLAVPGIKIGVGASSWGESRTYDELSWFCSNYQLCLPLSTKGDGDSLHTGYDWIRLISANMLVDSPTEMRIVKTEMGWAWEIIRARAGYCFEI